jgi:hypothetical protein
VPAYAAVNLASVTEVIGTLPIAQGGTNATTVVAARTNLGLGALATLGTVTTTEITDGTIASADLAVGAVDLSTNKVTGTLPIAQGGTNATTVVAARTNLGLGALATLGTVTTTEITDGTIADADISGSAGINGAKINPAFGAQAVSTTSTLTTGSAGQFVVDATGNITKIRNVATSFPAAQGAANSVLTNDGAGNLSWAASSGWGLSGNSLLGTEFIGSTNNQPLVFSTNTAGGGGERMRIDAAGNVGVGTIPTRAAFEQVGAVVSTSAIFGGGSQGVSLAQNSPGIGFNTYFDGGGTRAMDNGFGSAFTFNTATGDLYYYSSTASGAANAVLTTPNRLTILNNGDLGIGTVTPVSKLDVAGDVHLAQITAPAPTTDKLYNVGGSLFWNGTNISSAGSSWGLTGNSGTNPATNFIGTTDVQPLMFRVNNQAAGKIEYDNNANTLLGWSAGSSVTGINNAAFGKQALLSGSTGSNNAVIGSYAMSSNTTGSNNTAAGADAMATNVGGNNNSAFGRFALSTNLSGSNNTAVGSGADVITNNLNNATAIGYNAKVATSNSLVLGGTGVDAVNVGIGTTSPQSPLQIGNLLGFIDDTANGQNIIVRGLYSDGTDFRNVGTTSSSALLLGNERTGLFTFPAGAADAVSSSPSMRFNVRPTGVGIQVDNPIEILDVNGATNLRDMSATPPADPNNRLWNNAGVLTWDGAPVGGGSGWSLTGNAGTVDGTNFIGTTDAIPLSFLVNGDRGGRIEFNAPYNTFFGYQAGVIAGGTNNSAFGHSALASNTGGNQNTAMGTIALNKNVSGFGNVAVGAGALENNVSGNQNVAVGANALNINSNGNGNTAIGTSANVASAALTNATAIGANSVVTASNAIQLGDATVTTVNVGTGTTAKLIAGQLQITGGTLGANRVLTSDALGNATWQNAGSGWGLTGNGGTNPSTNFIGTTDNVALRFRTNNATSGLIDPLNSNAFFGFIAGQSTTGTQNVAMGTNALSGNLGGSGNVALGTGALQTNTSGTGNIAIGNFADVSSSGFVNSIAIGRNAIVGASNSMVLGGTGVDAVNVGIGTSQPVSDLQISITTHLFDFPSGSGFAHNMRESAGSLLHTTVGGASLLGLEPSKAGLYVNSTAAANASFGSSLANRIVLTETGVSINKDAADNSAVLHVVSETTGGGGTPRGFMMPAVITADRDAIPSPLTGLMVFNQTTNAFNFYNGTNWTPIAGASLNAGLGLTLNGSNLDLGATNMPTATTFQGAANNMLEIQSSGSALGTKAGIHFKMFQSAINTQYEIFTRKMDAIANSGNSDLVMTKVFSTAGGYLDAFTIDNGTNNVIINNNKTTTSPYGDFIVANGNVGIGTTTPVSKLQVTGATSSVSRAAGTLLDINATNIDNNAYIRFTQDGPAFQNPVFVGVDNDNGISEFWNPEAMDMRFGTDNLERMRILANGNVGIGISNPVVGLDVFSNKGIRLNSYLGAGSTASGSAYLGANLYQDYANNFWYWANTNGSVGGAAIGLNSSSASNSIQFFRAAGPSTADALAGTLQESMRIDASGNVGIGTTTPAFPLDVVKVLAFSTGFSTYFDGPTGNGPLQSGGNGGGNISVRASGAFLSTGSANNGGFYVTSDERIKRKIGISDSRNDLATLIKLKITDYKYIDSLNVGNVKVKGVFAQQVETVYPQAISKQTSFIPNIYAAANLLVFDEAKQTLRVTMAKAHDLNVGDKVKLISSTSGEKPSTVSAVDGNSFTVSNWTEKSEKLFVYGKEVNDFRIVDYDRLFTLNLSATQELNKKLEAQQQVIDSLQKQDAESKKKIAVLEASLSKVAAGETELTNLKSEIEKIKAALGMSVEATVKKAEEKTAVRKEK